MNQQQLAAVITMASRWSALGHGFDITDPNKTIAFLLGELRELAQSALSDHYAACTYCHCERMDLCRDWDYVRYLAALAPEVAQSFGYTEALGPSCRYCGADCSQGRSWDGGELYACPACADARSTP